MRVGGGGGGGGWGVGGGVGVVGGGVVAMTEITFFFTVFREEPHHLANFRLGGKSLPVQFSMGWNLTGACLASSFGNSQACAPMRSPHSHRAKQARQQVLCT